MQTILITGGNGFLGSHIVRSLLKQYKIIVLEKNAQKLSRIDDIKKELTIYDIDKIVVEDIFEKNHIDVVIHAATNYGRNSANSDMVKDNIIFPIRLLEIAELAKCKMFLNIDSFFNKPENKGYSYLGSYILCKSHLEEWLQNNKKVCKVVNIKLEHPYGPNDNPEKFVPQILSQLLSNQPEILLTEGNQLRDFIYIDDVADAFSFIIENSKKFETGFTAVSLGTGVQTSIKVFVETAQKIAGSTSNLKFGTLPYRENEIMSSIANKS